MRLIFAPPDNSLVLISEPAPSIVFSRSWPKFVTILQQLYTNISSLNWVSTADDDRAVTNILTTRNILDCDQSNVLLAHLLHTDRRQDLGDNISRDIANFSSNFVAMATTLGRGRIWLTSFNSPTQKTPDRHKDLGDISHTTWVIANFEPNFVAMATRVGCGRIWLTSLNSPIPKTPC